MSASTKLSQLVEIFPNISSLFLQDLLIFFGEDMESVVNYITEMEKPSHTTSKAGDQSILPGSKWEELSLQGLDLASKIKLQQLGALFSFISKDELYDIFMSAEKNTQRTLEAIVSAFYFLFLYLFLTFIVCRYYIFAVL